MKFFSFLLLFSTLSACKTQTVRQTPVIDQTPQAVIVGAARMEEYLPDLKGKSVALVVNHTSTIGKTHLADSLLALGINLKMIFAPEHGFRGTADAGETIKNGLDTKTGLPIVSLYGQNKKPSAEMLANIDVLIFDIQDVGARFYTFISTLHYIAEAAAENNKLLIVLDRPNPNGHYTDGPVLDKKFSSFVGLNMIPVVHGCTVGELAAMSNGENWLKNGGKCKLKIVKCLNYTHQTSYAPPIAPSPNLPNLQSMLLYPSICFFEPTEISVGRGTDTQFQVIGGPKAVYGNYTFTPIDKPGAMNPPNEGKVCYGQDLRNIDAKQMKFTLKYLIDYYKKSGMKDKFFNSPSFFDKLVGNDQLRKQLADGLSEEEIRKTWLTDLTAYRIMRKKYLLYEE